MFVGVVVKTIKPGNSNIRLLRFDQQSVDAPKKFTGVKKRDPLKAPSKSKGAKQKKCASRAFPYCPLIVNCQPDKGVISPRY